MEERCLLYPPNLAFVSAPPNSLSPQKLRAPSCMTHIPMALLSRQVTSTLPSGQSKLRPLTAPQPDAWHDFGFFKEGVQEEFVHLALDKWHYHIALQQRVTEQPLPRTGKWRTLHCALWATQRPCLNTGLLLTSLDLSFAAGLPPSCNLNTHSQFAVQLVARKKKPFVVWECMKCSLAIENPRYVFFSPVTFQHSHKPEVVIE